MIYQFLKIFSQRVFKLSSIQNFGFFSFLDPEIGPMVKKKHQTLSVMFLFFVSSSKSFCQTIFRKWLRVNFSLFDLQIKLYVKEKSRFGSARFCAIYLWYKFKVCRVRDSYVMARTIFFKKYLNLKNKSDNKCWYNLVTFYIIYLQYNFKVW